MKFISIFILTYQGSFVFLNSFFKKKIQSWSTGTQNQEQTSLLLLSVQIKQGFFHHILQQVCHQDSGIYTLVQINKCCYFAIYHKSLSDNSKHIFHIRSSFTARPSLAHFLQAVTKSFQIVSQIPLIFHKNTKFY